jgi:hypothetical protein
MGGRGHGRDPARRDGGRLLRRLTGRGVHFLPTGLTVGHRAPVRGVREAVRHQGNSGSAGSRGLPPNRYAIAGISGRSRATANNRRCQRPPRKRKLLMLWKLSHSGFGAAAERGRTLRRCRRCSLSNSFAQSRKGPRSQTRRGLEKPFFGRSTSSGGTWRYRRWRNRCLLPACLQYLSAGGRPSTPHAAQASTRTSVSECPRNVRPDAANPSRSSAWL